MALTLRGKLRVIVGTATLAFLVIIVAGALTVKRTQHELRRIEAVYVPKAELGPELEAQLERMQRGYQDAVQARDEDAFAASREAREAFIALLGRAGEAIDRAQVAALRTAVEDYDRAASDVSGRIVAGETGEPLVAAMGAMQQKRLRALELLRAATAFERGDLERAFAQTARAAESSATINLVVAVCCLLLVIALATWMARGILATLRPLTQGLDRFGAGDFERPIAVPVRDELGDVAVRANEMAARLRRLAEERERSDWLKEGVAGLVRELRGELTPEELGARVARYVASTLGAPAAALYVVQDDGALVLAGEHGASGTGAARRFERGEGLIGQAATREDLTVIEGPPADYLRVRSGLGEGAPRALVFLPLTHSGLVTGVLEIATFKPWSDLWTELLLAARETLAIAIVVARARAATRDLLVSTQRQAARLAAQEEELRATNEELQAQEEELRQANTDLSRQTEELEARRRLLAERNADLDDVRVRLEQRAAELATVSTYKSQFLANMSHELRTPLNSMLLLSNLLAENEGGTLSPKQVEFARTIYGAGRDLLGLINQVLDLAKVESGRQEVELASVPLSEVVAQLERIFAPLAREKGLGFSATLAADLPEALVTDRRRLEQILTNLLGNAMKFTSRGQVAFRIERAGPATQFRRPELSAAGALAFAVTDTGLGIAPQDQDRVFAPFEQVDGASDRRYGGTGLGLGIARELATLLGGELQLTSALGEGSTFTCLLPLTRQPSKVASAAVEAVAEPAGPVEGGGPFLLLIEDDPIFATTFGDVITSQGLRYVQARSGQAGLRIARERRPSGIILDVKLPDTDGWRVMEALRADSATAQIPVHFVSALDGAERGLALGAVGYLRKPVSRQDLLDVIEALVPRGSPRTPRVLVVEDDALTASSVLRMLEAESLEARRVSTAEHALDVLRQERFACMILDLSLPEMSGLDLLRALRDARVPDPPRVVVYTARSLSRVETVMIESYAEAVVVKDGSSVERLLDEVKLFVRRLDGTRREPRPVAPLPSAAADARFEGCKVLLADDDMRTVYALSATLRAKGIDVVVAENGRAAVEALDAQPDVAVVLMDIMMPEMDGYEAMRRIRADQRFGALPIVALTAKAMKGDEEKCVEAGATHYLPKPVDAGRLMSLLRTCLAREERGLG
jgi:CheY-like chemotaxis protein/signal transduction histidine kinase